MNSIESYQDYQQSLEAEFISEVICKVSTKKKSGFLDYFEPNEKNPQRVKKHLDLADKGIIVSAGTERSFFDLIFSNSEKCEGIVIRDINSRVKAYVDFNTLLLRISNDREEYFLLSKKHEYDEDIEDRIKVISQKILNGSLPEKMRKYYLKNLRKFSTIYFSTYQNWRDLETPFFEHCRYFLKDDLFSKLQKYAQDGNIIATIGDINHLKFLASRKISIIDTSNISDTTFLDLQGGENFNPRVIHTRFNNVKTKYFSYPYSPLSKGEREEFDELVLKLNSCFEKPVEPMFYRMYVGNDYLYNKKYDSKFNIQPCPSYTAHTLLLLKNHVSQKVITVPGVGFVHRYNSLNRAT